MQLKTCEICLTEHFDELPCPNCETSIDLSEVEEAKPIGFISDETRQWLLDENGRGPGMFTPNRNGAGGVWAIYGGWEYKRLLTIAKNLQKQCVLMHGVVAAARTLYGETEEYDFPDGMGKGALQEYWDALADALEPELDAALKAAQPERVSVPRDPSNSYYDAIWQDFCKWCPEHLRPRLSIMHIRELVRSCHRAMLAAAQEGK